MSSLKKSNIIIAIFNCFLPFIINLLIISNYKNSTALIDYKIFLLNFLFQIILFKVKFFPSRLLLYFWYFNYLIGMLFLNNSIIVDPKFKVYNNNNAEVYYFICLIALSLGIYIYELKYYFSKKYIYVANDNIPVFTKYILLFFPLLFLLSIFLNLGFLPMFSGDFVEYMYTFNFGYLYGFKIIILFSCFYLIVRINLVGKNKLFYIFQLIFAFLVSLVDGRRVVGLYIIIGSIIFYFFYFKKIISNNLLLSLLGIMAFFYVIIDLFRSGNFTNFKLSNLLASFPFGVEFTDFVYSYNNLKAKDLIKYDYLSSSLGSFFNSSILSFLGFKKNDLILSASETVWMNLYGINQGVRTGIICELYFFIGDFSIGILFLLGLYVGYLGKKILLIKDLFSMMYFCCVYTLIFFLIVGQSSVFWGTLPTLIYFLILNNILVYIFGTKNSNKNVIQKNFNKNF